MALPGSTVQPVCSVIEGNVPVSLSWSNPGGSNLTSSQRYNTSAATIITQAGSGVYTCIGSNSCGSLNITFTIIEAGKNTYKNLYKNYVFLNIIKTGLLRFEVLVVMFKNTRYHGKKWCLLDVLIGKMTHSNSLIFGLLP